MDDFRQRLAKVPKMPPPPVRARQNPGELKKWAGTIYVSAVAERILMQGIHRDPTTSVIRSLQLTYKPRQ